MMSLPGSSNTDVFYVYMYAEYKATANSNVTWLSKRTLNGESTNLFSTSKAN